jgi:molecular chaperone DnaJ
MTQQNHYDTLEVNPTASQAEIKQAYRRLAKRFHPDSQHESASHDRIAQLNAAYEVLGDPQQRRFYDRHLQYQGDRVEADPRSAQQARQQRAADAQKRHNQRRTSRDSDEQLQLWLTKVYQPVNRLLNQILKPLKAELNDLSADPFDDELIDAFQAYLDDSRLSLQKAQRLFRSVPNPPNVASVAAHLYYCLNQVSDGIDELERFITSYDDHYLHTGQELFRIANGLRREAQSALREIAS